MQDQTRLTNLKPIPIDGVPSTRSSKNTDTEGSNVSLPVVIGSVCAAVFALLAAFILLVYIRRRKSHRKRRHADHETTHKGAPTPLPLANSHTPPEVFDSAGRPNQQPLLYPQVGAPAGEQWEHTPKQFDVFSLTQPPPHSGLNLNVHNMPGSETSANNGQMGTTNQPHTGSMAHDYVYLSLPLLPEPSTSSNPSSTQERAMQGSGRNFPRPQSGVLRVLMLCTS